MCFHVGGVSMARAQHDSVVIYVHAGGVHSDVIIPIKTSHWDWTNELESPPTFDNNNQEQWMAFGWGSKSFYLKTPSWAEAKPLVVLGAMIGVGGAAYHIHTEQLPQESKHCKALRLSKEEYLALCSALLKGFSSKSSQKQLLAFKTGKSWDAFYAAKGYYCILNNCNSWTNLMLRQCGHSRAHWVLTYRQLFHSI
jgi:uncharacterized protein (TIGR02117 family)